MIFNQLSVGQTDNVLTADAELCVYVHHRMYDVADMAAPLSLCASPSPSLTPSLYEKWTNDIYLFILLQMDCNII